MTTMIKVPAVGESITEVTVGKWLKGEGAYVAQDEIICELESEKANFEIGAEESGILHPKAKEGDTLPIGALIAEITAAQPPSSPSSQKADKKSVPTKEKHPQTAEKPQGATSGGGVSGHPAPAAAKILSEKNITPSQINGTGVGGRITKEDALRATPAISGEKKGATTPTVGLRTERRERMSSLRKTITKRLVAVKNETAMLTTFNEVDMEPIISIRKRYKESFKERYEVGLGFMSFFVRAVCLATRDWPTVNARIEGEELVYSDFCDISIAVSTPRGLVVPVIRNAERLSFAEVEQEILRLASKAREGKLSIEEMKGGTFTITNGGIFGSMLSTPIINAPQSAILGLHNIVERPVAVDGTVVVRPVMYLALSYDHRIVDGRESVSFLVRVKELLEAPTRLFLGL